MCLATLSHQDYVAAEPEAYQLSAERHEAYGNYYGFKSEVDRKIQTTESRNGQTTKEEKQTVEAKMAGTAWVSDTNARGEIREVVIYPEAYTGKVNGEEVELIPGERLFVQMQDGEVKVFNSAGHSMSAEVVRVIDALLGFMLAPDQIELSTNKMLALDPPRKPGQSWPCDHESLVTSLNQAWDIRVEAEHLQSENKFVKVIKRFDEDAAELTLDIKLNAFDTPALTKQGFTVDQSAGSVKVQRVLPIDPVSMNGKVSKQVELTTTASADHPDQGKVQVQQITTLKTQAEYQIK